MTSIVTTGALSNLAPQLRRLVCSNGGGCRPVFAESLRAQAISGTESTGQQPLPHKMQTIRTRHSKTQVKRLFKNHPARSRVFARNDMIKKPGVVPERKYPKVYDPRHVLPNGWSSPPSAEEGFELPKYPFSVTRTAGKPNGGVGFLPVYSDYRVHGTKHTTIIRKVTGDREAFVSELRAVLGLSPRDEAIRIRAGGNIEVDGNRVREVKEWLGGLGL